MDRWRKSKKRGPNAAADEIASVAPHCCLRFVLGLSGLDMQEIKDGGDKVRPGKLPPRCVAEIAEILTQPLTWMDVALCGCLELILVDCMSTNIGPS